MADNTQDFGFFGKKQSDLRDLRDYTPPPSPHVQPEQHLPQKLTTEGLQQGAAIEEAATYSAPQAPVTPIQNTPPTSSNPASVFGAPDSAAVAFNSTAPALPEASAVAPAPAPAPVAEAAPAPASNDGIPNFSAIFGNKLPEEAAPLAPLPPIEELLTQPEPSVTAPEAEAPIASFENPVADPSINDLPSLEQPQWEEPALPPVSEYATSYNSLPEDLRSQLGALSYEELQPDAQLVFNEHFDHNRKVSTALRDTIDALATIRAEEQTSGIDKIEATALSTLLQHTSLQAPQDNLALQFDGFDLLQKLAETLPDSAAKSQLVDGASTLLETGFILPVGRKTQTAISEQLQTQHTAAAQPEFAVPEAEAYPAAPQPEASFAPEPVYTPEPSLTPEPLAEAAEPAHVPTFQPSFVPQAPVATTHQERLDSQKASAAASVGGPHF